MTRHVLKPGFKSVHGIVVSDDENHLKSGRLETIGPKFRIDLDMFQVCRCECGTILVVDAVKLRQKTRPFISCGCIKAKHNMRNSAFYKEWRRIKFNLPHPESWNDFQKFYEEVVADIGEQPDENSRIKKIDTNDILRVGNIQWQSKKPGNTPKTTKKNSSQPPKEAAKSLCLF